MRQTIFHSGRRAQPEGPSGVRLLDSAYLIKVEQDLSAVQLVSLQANSLVHQQLLGNAQGGEKKKKGAQQAEKQTSESVQEDCELACVSDVCVRNDALWRQLLLPQRF